jgi:seryl-tRNA synthetase
MIDLKVLLEKPDEIKKALLKKHFDGDLDNVIKLDRERKALMQETESLKANQNQIAKQIPTASPGEKPGLLEKSATLKEQLKEIEPKLKNIDTKLHAILLTIPNPPHETVPAGKDESENKVIKTVGQKREFDFTVKDHVELGMALNLLEIEKAVEMSGSRFYYLKNDLVMLEFALVNYALNKLQEKGFSPIISPMLVKEHAMEATGFFPADRNAIYHVNPEDDDLFLIGTAEVPLCMLHAKEIIEAEKLPLKYCGYSSCYRREAGTYGKDMQGIFRVHQFEKIEMFVFCKPEDSWAEHEKILGIEEEIMQELGLHYQVVNICGGDLGAPAAKKYDIEVWIQSQQKYRELTSCSNCTDFQARHAQIRLKKEDGTKQILHTLNGTAIAMTRMIIAIMENYQQKDGTIKVPDILKPYFNKEFIGK